MRKREGLVAVAQELMKQLNPGNGIEAVVVISSTDGEFVGVQANVPLERAEAIMRAAATRSEHVEHTTPPMDLSNESYRAFYKRIALGEFLEERAISRDDIMKAILEHTGAAGHPSAEAAYKMACNHFQSHRHLEDRIGLYYDIMRVVTGSP